jgi:hypothetical protein
MLKIGFADYFLDEWHANNYPKWFRAASEQLGEECKVSYAWAELDTPPSGGKTTDEWCLAMGVERCASLAELCEKSDVIVILSPDNPERHLDYAKAVLPYGKRTYIDKTFAPDYATALKIFEIAKAHSTPFFSTSALRYAEELAAAHAPDGIITTGGGLLSRYIVHQAEMVVAKLGTGDFRVTARKQGAATLFSVDYENGKRATMLHAPSYGFGVSLAKGDEEITPITPVASPFFAALILDMARFFLTGNVSFDPAETLAVMKLIDLCLQAERE